MAAKRVKQNPRELRALNLHAACLAMLERYEEAEQEFVRLSRQSKASPYKERVLFNLGLVRLYIDLGITGDCSVAKNAFAPPSASFRLHVSATLPFSRPIETWTKIISRRNRNENVVRTYLSFALLQFGRIDGALAHIIQALGLSESYFVSNFVLGRIFLDLYMLGAEDNHFYLSNNLLTFFEIEDAEIRDRKDNLAAIYHEIYLDFALQAFTDARALNPYSVEVLLGLFHTYMLGGMFEEAQQVLFQAENLAPDALPILDAHFRLNELTQKGVEHIRPLVARLHRLKQKNGRYLGQFLIPANYLV